VSGRRRTWNRRLTPKPEHLTMNKRTYNVLWRLECAVMALIGAQPRFTIGGSLVAAAHMAVPLLCAHFNL
jgi:hypothetical protein